MNRVALATGQQFDGVAATHYMQALNTGLLEVGVIPGDARGIMIVEKPGYLLVTEDFIAGLGGFPQHAIVYASACFSSSGRMPSVFTGAPPAHPPCLLQIFALGREPAEGAVRTTCTDRSRRPRRPALAAGYA